MQLCGQQALDPKQFLLAKLSKDARKESSYKADIKCNLLRLKKAISKQRKSLDIF